MRIEPDADVRNAEMDGCSITKKLEFRFPDSAVLHRVAEGFLSYTEQAQGGLLGECERDVPVNKVDLGFVLFRILPAESLDRGYQSQVVELC